MYIYMYISGHIFPSDGFFMWNWRCLPMLSDCKVVFEAPSYTHSIEDPFFSL